MAANAQALLMEERRYTTISIPQPLYLEVKKAIEGTGFRSPTEFLVYVTRLALQNAQPPAPVAPAVANPLMAPRPSATVFGR